ncbi:MAG TPA: hypothetical protein VNO30_09470 [Kofleriaceae bacterium]|nr:hypothetical protein [Kofleriaceae bacterium]
MIPYDDLVAALTAWRARQGLPTAQLPGAPAPAPKAAVSTPTPATKSGPARAATDGGRSARAPSPAIVHDDSFEAEEVALIDDASYEPDFAGFDNELGESTALGTTPAPSRRGGR